MTLIESIKQMLLTAGIDNVFLAEGDNISDELVTLRTCKSSLFDAKAAKQCVRVIAAARTPEESEALAWQAFYALNGQVPQGTDKPIVGRITPLQAPYYWEKDKEERFQNVFRFNVVSEI